MDLWVNGIYDISTFQFLKENVVTKFSFDFRPLSLNFIQEYKMHDILEKCDNQDLDYSLYFANERDYVVKKILEDAKIRLGRRVVLEFEGAESEYNFSDFKTKFYWHFDLNCNFHKILNSDYCQGMIFHSKTIHEILSRPDGYQFFNDINQQEKEIIVYLDEGYEYPESFIDFIKVKSIILPLSSQLENSYRDINKSLLGQKINSMKRVSL